MAEASVILRSPWLQWLLARLFPSLREWPVREWPGLLERTTAADFDQVERLGILAGVVCMTWLLEPAAILDASIAHIFLTQFLLSLPLLLILAGPFFWRRTRRYLDAEARLLHDGQSESFGERN